MYSNLHSKMVSQLNSFLFIIIKLLAFYFENYLFWMCLWPSDCLQVVLLLTGTVTLNGHRELLPVVTGDLVVHRASSSFLLIQTFGAQLLWHLDGPLVLITLQPGFANKVTCTPHMVNSVVPFWVPRWFRSVELACGILNFLTCCTICDYRERHKMAINWTFMIKHKSNKLQLY